MHRQPNTPTRQHTFIAQKYRIILPILRNPSCGRMFLTRYCRRIWTRQHQKHSNERVEPEARPQQQAADVLERTEVSEKRRDQRVIDQHASKRR